MRQYSYLAVVALLAVGLLIAYIRLMPKLVVASQRRNRAEKFLLAASVVIALVAVYWLFYTEQSCFAYGRGDFGSDTYEQYVPFYANLIQRIRDGSLGAWNFEFGLGTSIAATQTWTFDPFNLFLIPFVLVTGNTHLSLGLVLSQSLKVVASVFLFDHLLTRYCETPLARILGSLLYGLSGFMLLYGQHYWLGSVYPVFTLTVLLFELYLEKATPRSFLMLAVCLGVLCAWSPYIAFMVLLFCVFYLLLRIPVVCETKTFPDYLKTIARMCAPVACGLLLSGIGFIPYVEFLLGETTRTGSNATLIEVIEEGLTGFINPEELLLTLSRMLGSGLVNNGSAGWEAITASDSSLSFDPYEFTMLGFSGGILILLGQFFHWLFTEAGKRERALASTATALVALFCVNYFLPTLFTGMVKVQYRASFVLNVPICAAAAMGWEKRIGTGKTSLPCFVVSAAATFGILAWSTMESITGKLTSAYFAAAIALLCVLLWLLATNRVPVAKALPLMLGVIVSTSVFDAFNYTNRRVLMSSSDFPMAIEPSRDTDTLAALEYLNETDPGFYRVEKFYAEWVPVNDSLVQRFDGASAYDPSLDADIEEFYDKLWDGAIVHGVAWSKTFKNDPNEPAIAELLGIKYILSTSELGLDWLTFVKSFGSVYVYQVDASNSIATLRNSVVAESVADSLESSEDRRALLSDAAIVPDDVAASFDDVDDAILVANAEVEKTDDAHLTGSITTDSKAVVCFAIPYTAGWKIYVNGEEVETFRVNYGFYGFIVEAGTYTIEAVYSLDGLDMGCKLSIAGLACTTAACIFVARQCKNRSVMG